MARDYPDDVQAILAEHRERVVETVDALRELVFDTLPAGTRLRWAWSADRAPNCVPIGI
jgi:hypothetical protein